MYTPLARENLLYVATYIFYTVRTCHVHPVMNYMYEYNTTR